MIELARHGHEVDIKPVFGENKVTIEIPRDQLALAQAWAKSKMTGADLGDLLKNQCLAK